MKVIKFIWEGAEYPVNCESSNSHTYIDFVSLLDGLGVEGRQDLISVLLTNYGDEVEQDEAEVEDDEEANERRLFEKYEKGEHYREQFYKREGLTFVAKTFEQWSRE